MRGAYEKSGGDYYPFADPINGGMVGDGITLAFDYEENRFREGAENDAYVLYRVDFLYADNSYAQIRSGELAALNIEWVP